MALPKRSRVWGLSLVTAGVVGAGAVAAFTAGAAGSSGGKVTARYAKTSDWGSGFQGEYTLTNGTGRTVRNWTVSFDLPAGERISALWNGTMTAAGQHITVTNPIWGGDIVTGTSASFGFVVDAAGGSGTPQNCLINGASCSDGAAGDAPSPSPTSASSTPSNSLPSSTQPSATQPTSPSSSASPVPPATSGGSYRFAPYVDTSQRQDLGALASSAGVKYLTAAFMLSGNSCTPSWNGNSDSTFTAALKAGLADLRAQGGDAIASFGGANGTELAQACKDETSLKAAYKSVIDEYGFTHLDFDIEGAAGTDQTSITRRWQVLAQLQNDYAAAGKPLDISLTLPVLPSGLTPEGVAVVSAAATSGVKLSLVNVLAMDYGDWAAPSPTGRMGHFAAQAAQSLHDQLRTVFPSVTDTQLWAMVGITPMIGVNDTAGEIFQTTDAQAVEQFAAQHHIGRLAMWSLTRDKMCAQQSSWADPTCSSIQQSAYDFAHTLGAFTG